jgi:energy-coupling factor transporter ATP-binding protein EcfA2
MISSFHIRNFKSYRDATLPLAPLTLLIGANASGKSNAIEAIRVLALVGAGRRLDEIVSEIQSSDDLIRGNAWDLPRDRQHPIELGCVLDSGGWNELELALSVADRDVWVGDEVIRRREGPYLYHASRSPEVRGERTVHVSAVGTREGPHLLVTDRTALFPWMDSVLSPDPTNPVTSRVRDVGTHFHAALGGVEFFDPQPRRMRGYSYEGDQTLKEDGSNLSAVLYALTSAFGSAGSQILKFVAEIPEHPFLEIDFIVTERRDVMVRLTESYGNNQARRDAPVLSDGTIRVLGIAAALFSARPGSTLVIEEIDNGVHPSRAETLLRNIERVAKERDLRVLLTTHNPALLDRLPTDAIPNVVCAYRDPDEGDSRLVRLQDLPNYPELVARGPLGQLMTRGVLDYFLKHQETSEEKQERSQRWLEALKAQVGDA